MNEGYCKGEVCGRDGCVGIIDEHEKDGCCSCHINPPCSYCTTPSEYCPECNWCAEDEQREKNAEELERYRSIPHAPYIHKSDQELLEELPADKFNYVRFPSGRSFVRLKGNTGGLSMTGICKELNLHENPHMPRFKSFGDKFELTYFCD